MHEMVFQKALKQFSFQTQGRFLTYEFYCISLALEVTFLFIMIGYLGFSIFYAFRKIKKQKVEVEVDEESSTEDSDSQEQDLEGVALDQLIYRYDEEDHEKQRGPDCSYCDQEMSDSESDLSSGKEDEQAEEQLVILGQKKFISIDQKFILLQPLLLGHIVYNSFFYYDTISMSLVLCMVILFCVFNLKGVKRESNGYLFLIPGILSYIPVVIANQ